MREYGPGEVLGELSLLYRVLRPTTVVAKTESVLWRLSRQTFNGIVKDVATY